MHFSSIYGKGKDAVAMLPYKARDLLNKSSGVACRRFRMAWRHTVTVEQKDSWHINDVFYAVKTYLDSLSKDDDKPVVRMEEGEEMVDVFKGAEFRWCLYTHHDLSGGGSSKLYFQLTFHKKHKKKALGEYVAFVVDTARAMRNKGRPLTTYIVMNDGSQWTPPLALYHHSTFATLIMDRALKQSVIHDLDKFFNTKAYFKRIGKAWKRSYLLYGPPGTDKFSLITAMANHLGFHIYELELTGAETNSQLTGLLLGITNRSILVIELKQGDDKKKKPPNSDSAKDEEKSYIYNRDRYSEGHSIHTYFAINDLMAEIEELMPEVAVTPAEVANTLARNDDTHKALLDLMELLKSKNKRSSK
ncbi:unnamed protein product [Alopecurus aequalis]